MERGEQGRDTSLGQGLLRLPGSWDLTQRTKACSRQGRMFRAEGSTFLGVRAAYRILLGLIGLKRLSNEGPQTTDRTGFLGLERTLLEARESLSTSCQRNSLHSPSRRSPSQPVESRSLHCKPISLGFQHNSEPPLARSDSHI